MGIRLDVSSHDDVKAAFDQLRGSEQEAPEVEPEPVAEESAPEPEIEAAAEPEVEAKPERSRDETGKFAKEKAKTKEKPGKEAKPAKAGAKAVEEESPPLPSEAAEPLSEAKPAKEPIKPPKSWKAGAQAAFAKLPPEIQEILAPEVERRDKEIESRLSETESDRKLAREFKEAIGPFEGFLRAQGVPSLSVAAGNAVGHFMRLQMAPTGQKEELFAQMFKGLGGNIEALDDALARMQSGQPAPQAQAQQQQFRDPRFDQFLSMWEQQQRGSVQNQVNAFEAKHAEYFQSGSADDLRHAMTLVIQEHKRRTGESMSLDDAYPKAIRLVPEIAALEDQKEAAKRAAAQNASAQRAKAAASSIKSHPATVAPKATRPGSTEDDVRAAVAQLRSRRA